MLYLVSRFIFPFLFVLVLIWKHKTIVYPLFSLNWKTKISKITNNYRIAHQKNHAKITMTELSTNSSLIRIGRFPVQTLLGVWPGLGTESGYEARGELQLKIVKTQ